MRTTQLIQLLKVMNAAELKAFKATLKYKPAKTKKIVQPLFDYLNKFAPTYDSPKLNRVIVFKKIFKTQPINNNQLNKVAFQLKTLLEAFLISYDLTQDVPLKDKLLVQALEKRNHPDFAKASQQLITGLSQKDKKVLVAADYLDLFQVNYALWSNINTKKIDSNLELLQTANTHLDTFYLLKKLKIILEEKTSKSIIAENKAFGESLDISLLVKQQIPLNQHPVIKLFLSVIQMVENSKIADYQIVKKALFETMPELTKKDAQDILITLTNFYNKHKGENPDFWKKEAFDLYSFAAEKGLLIDNGRIRYIEYCNAAMAGIITQNFDWSTAFIQKNKPFLTPEIRPLIYAYIQAFYYFQKRDFNQVIKLLKSIDLMDSFVFNMDINIRTLNLRALFERWFANDSPAIEEQNMLINQITSFEGYIIRHKKLSTNKKENYKQFALFFRLLVNAVDSSVLQKENLLNLKKKLANTHSVSLREWLETTLQRLIANLPHE